MKGDEKKDYAEVYQFEAPGKICVVRVTQMSMW